MIRHQAKGMDTAPEAFNALLEEEAEVVSVHVVKEDILTGVPAQDYVVACTGMM